MSNISIIGSGYVGLVTAACFAEFGNKVTVLAVDKNKPIILENGTLPVNEPDLEEIWQRNRKRGRINVTDDYFEGLLGTGFTFIAVDVPSGNNGKPDLKLVRLAAMNIAMAASGPMTVVIESTVPVGTAEIVSRILAHNNVNNQNFKVVSNPEYLREGCAVDDFTQPFRLVIGSANPDDAEDVVALYQNVNCPVFRCDNRTAEISKYCCNAFMATRISFMNEIALLCDEYGVDVTKVAEIVGTDPRLNDGHIRVGLGWGGSNLPRDLRYLIQIAKSSRNPARLLRAVQLINQQQVNILIRKLRDLLGLLEGKTIGVLGLSFKPNSEDIQESQSMIVISLLEDEGCHVKAYDPNPAAMQKATRYNFGVNYCADAYEVARDSDALILITEWEEFKELDMPSIAASMTHPILIDGRNMYDPDEMFEAGFLYEGIGRCSRRTQETRFGLIQHPGRTR
jgi:UDPglucose 6-dehydrogenase